MFNVCCLLVVLRGLVFVVVRCWVVGWLVSLAGCCLLCGVRCALSVVCCLLCVD